MVHFNGNSVRPEFKTIKQHLIKQNVSVRKNTNKGPLRRIPSLIQLTLYLASKTMETMEKVCCPDIYHSQ